ncbi:low-density lipoprotein receptor-related protein 2-like [Octopus vulgaris]|uniref:Low-density lipoprotein receptor-related protein 2-like n=1 Tax=Octopus vulgaris TaxID=6645 RepID=A0AA36B5B4_OCTVU|nr:low-density lipoprotein receptor-related protein 2-like [Octopus vulgaris]
MLCSNVSGALSGCLGNQFACNSGQCVKQEFLCNGVTNCEDESDEQVCSSRRCGLLSCLYRCNPSPEGGMCYCADGMALKPDDKRTCIDFNECSSWGYCDQICTNKQYGYTCSCQAGFTLTGKQMCRANNSENARLIVSSNKRLFSMKTDGSDIKLIATTSLSPVAFDSHRNKIFWANAHDSDKREFWESDLSGENKRSIPLKTTFNIILLSFDWIANNLYYEDRIARSIGILSLDNRRQCRIITTGLTKTFSIALDPLVGFEIIAGGNYIPSPVAITHFESHLFWADLHKGKIMKMNKNGSISTLTEIYHNTSEIPQRLKIFHSSLQPQGRNPCKQAKCQHICVVTHTSDNDGLGYRCLCEIGFIPDSNQLNCTRVTKFILFSKRRLFKGLPLDRKFSINADIIPPLPNTFSTYSYIRSFDYTASDQTIYFADSYKGLFKFNLNTLELKLVSHDYVSDISVDWMLRNLYVASRLGITVVRIDNVDDKRVIISNETSVRSIVCHPYKGIQRSDLDGNNVQTLGITLRTPVRIFVYGDNISHY